MTRLTEIEGIGQVYQDKLQGFGIRTLEDLLEQGKDRRGRERISERTGISPKLILEWVNLADLFRIKGVGEEYADLLEEAGVDSVPELAQRNPENLHKALVEINEQKDLVRRTPSLDQVKEWVNHAKELPRVVEH